MSGGRWGSGCASVLGGGKGGGSGDINGSVDPASPDSDEMNDIFCLWSVVGLRKGWGWGCGVGKVSGVLLGFGEEGEWSGEWGGKEWGVESESSKGFCTPSAKSQMRFPARSAKAPQEGVCVCVCVCEHMVGGVTVCRWSVVWHDDV